MNAGADTRYVRVQQLWTRTTIMYAYNNYVRIQQKCMRITIMYAYNNKVCVNCSTRAHVRVQYTHKLTRAHTLCIVSTNALPPHPEKIEMTSLLFHKLNKSAVVSLSCQTQYAYQLRSGWGYYIHDISLKRLVTACRFSEGNRNAE